MRKYNIAQISFLIACGTALQLAETFVPFPVPIPGLRVGLANIATLLGIVLFGAPAGFEVAIFRPIITSLMNGTFLSPVLFLSFTGSVTSFMVMAAIYYVVRDTSSISIITISIIGAVVHNVAEIALAYFWLFHHRAVLVFAPIMVLLAVIGGYLAGWSTKYVLDRIEHEQLNSFPSFNGPEDAKYHVDLRASDKLKISGAFVLVLSTIVLESVYAYLALILIVLVLIFVYGDNKKAAGSRVLSLWGIVVFSFVLPAVFSTHGAPILEWWIFKVTYSGILEGALFALRILFLILISAWIGVTDPSKLSQELAWMLSPLKYFRFSVDRIPRITSLSLSFVPLIWEKLSKLKPKTLKTVLNTLAEFFVGLVETKQAAG